MENPVVVSINYIKQTALLQEALTLAHSHFHARISKFIVPLILILKRSWRKTLANLFHKIRYFQFKKWRLSKN